LKSKARATKEERPAVFLPPLLQEPEAPPKIYHTIIPFSPSFYIIRQRTKSDIVLIISLDTALKTIQ
jgi:hypothetical protein